MIREEECGADLKRLKAWVAATPLNCRVTIEPLPDRVLGSVRLPRSILRFEGEADACEHAYAAFYQAFMSAGG